MTGTHAEAAGKRPWLLTPGPLTTAPETRAAMGEDWGSRDLDFRALIASIRTRLLALAHAPDGTECVLMQGSGTFAIESALGCLVPEMAHVLVAVNGAYGRRAAKILGRHGRRHTVIDLGDETRIEALDIERAFAGDESLTHLFIVHCETTSGIVNPLHDICAAAKDKGAVLILDAMSSFGALPLDMARSEIDVMVSSANKCLEGVPGFAYVLCRRDLLEAAQGRSPTLSLDLHDQWRAMEANGQFRFTPPTHALVAFSAALDAHAAEGGVAARGRRYARNRAALVAAMRALGFETLLDDDVAGPIIQTFLAPDDPAFEFDRFYDALLARGFAIYPGKLTERPSFRIGTIGALDHDVMACVAAAIADCLDEMGVKKRAPA